jgi:hypothetical protein
MEHALLDSSSSSRSGYMAEVTRALLFLYDTGASGRLSLRHSEHFMIVHLYFKEARLVHVAGNKSDVTILLNDLLTWTRGSVRYDAGRQVSYETLTWQQAQIFARWLAFIEMRGIMQGIARARLQGLTQGLTAHLPGEPITLPEEIANYEEYVEAARARQWQRFNEGIQQLIERAMTDEQREQLKQATQRVNQALQQAGEATQDVAKRMSRAAQEGLAQALTTAQEVTRQGTRRAEEMVKQSLSPERRQETQQIIQSVQETVESIKQTVGQKVENALAQAAPPLPPELQARSIRHRSAIKPSAPAAAAWHESQ